MAIGRPLKRVLKSSPRIESQAMAQVNTGGIEPLYSGVQITQRGESCSTCCRSIKPAGNPLALIRGVNRGRSSSVRSNTVATDPKAVAASLKRLASLRFSPLLAVMIRRLDILWSQDGRMPVAG